MITSILVDASVFVLGLFAGSLMLEGLVLVPFWRTLAPADFFKLHHEFGKRLFTYFAPLTTAAALIPLILALVLGGKDWAANAAACASLSVLAFFPLYFQKANLEFANRTISDAQLAGRLRIWARLHALRTCIAIIAFGTALGVQIT